ncbi:hypothetical protein CAP35_12080 [Chitinophagaceae bacterium IBVUCB1]|nr:hypothetical protein CAP35_12080 [Chitinophagaceae bacterium IBVUCB1]
MNALQTYRHNEPLEDEERAFLQNKLQKESAQFYKIVRILLVFCFACPFLIAWFRAMNGVEDPFSYKYYFGGVLFLATFSGSIVYVAYHNTLRRVRRDIKKGTKTIERVHITRKQYMPHNNTYYIYLTSPVKLSIEVSADDYRQMGEGDELNIEYTTYSKFYLGYF